MLKTNKILRLRNQPDRLVQVVREHYVREDVPCYSSVCIGDCAALQDSRLSVLPKDATHYVVPDCQLARDYHEVLDFPELTGIILMQTVINSIQQKGRRAHRRLTNLVKDARRQSIVFYNEFQKYSYCPREPGEQLVKWQTRSVYEGAVWYYNHLAGQMSIVVLTADREVVAEYSGRTVGVYVVHIADYLEKFWPEHTSVQLLYESLSASIQEQSASKNNEYTGYLPAEVLQAGVQSGLYIQGNLRVNKHQAATEAYVRTSSLSGKMTSQTQEVLISGNSHRNRAVHGDTVVVGLLPRTQWRIRSNALKDNDAEVRDDDGDEEGDIQPTGKVIGVINHNWRDYIVSIEKEESLGTKQKTSRILTVPMNWRIPKIRISTRQINQLRQKRFVVRIDSWDVGSQYPNGHFVRSLGASGDLETELEALLIEHQLSTASFSEAQMKELPTNSPERPWSMDPDEIHRRSDLRDSHLIFSIDPRGCEDVDDTLSVRQLDKGHLELGVHIADVTHFVPYNSLNDLEARARSTTVYLADRRFDMLPAILSADLCSLISGVDRYAMSVVWELDEDYEVVNVWYGRTVIRSSYKLYYEFAQKLSETEDVMSLAELVPELSSLGQEEQMDKLESLQWSVRKLMEIARHLKSRRCVGGALELESTEVAVQMAESKEITDLVPKQSLEIHDTIAECMIFANHWVAKKICESYPDQALLRHHPLPRQDQFSELQRCAKARGFSVETSSNKALADSLDLCQDPADPVVNKVLRSLATMAMSNAAYFSTGSLPRHEYFHYGLALDYYTHFTSPIRRYADIIVHRLLLASLGVLPTTDLIPNSGLQELSEHMNDKHRSAQNAQRASVELFQSLYFKDRSPDDEASVVDGVILQIRSNGVVVYIPRYGIKGPVYLKNREGLVAYVEDSGVEWMSGHITDTPMGAMVSTAVGMQLYHLLDHLTVRISVQSSHAHSSRIKLELVNNAVHHSDTDIASLDSKQQKAAIIKEVTTASEENKMDDDLVQLGPDFERWKLEYGQTAEEKSFYNLVQSINDNAKLDL